MASRSALSGDLNLVIATEEADNPPTTAPHPTLKMSIGTSKFHERMDLIGIHLYYFCKIDGGNYFFPFPTLRVAFISETFHKNTSDRSDQNKRAVRKYNRLTLSLHSMRTCTIADTYNRKSCMDFVQVILHHTGESLVRFT